MRIAFLCAYGFAKEGGADLVSLKDKIGKVRLS
jgi:hypothetical protein